jgi:beta-glucosidase
MNSISRRNWFKLSLTAAGTLAVNDILNANLRSKFIANLNPSFTRLDFGNNFIWGTACAAYQVEGAKEGGKGEDIWDRFTHTSGKIKTGENGDQATDFYHLYKQDIQHIREMNFGAFRFSLSWSRIFPNGTGTVNKDGVEFYHQVIDSCLENGISPWITLYHWDLPQALEEKGGWANREILDWFSYYVDFCTREYGEKVKNWMVLNEPMAFVGLGYMLGAHAPGRKGISGFLPAVHHTTLCQAEGGRIIRKNVKDANIGTTFSCSWVDSIDNKPKNIRAAKRMDVISNRLFIEPALGMGYPTEEIPALRRLEKYFRERDAERLKFDFDFIGVQNYFRTVAKKSLFPPFLWAKEIPASERGVPVNEMDGEVSPDGMYKILKQFGNYKGVKRIIITENGACFNDVIEDGRIHDYQRIDFFKNYLTAVLKAKMDGVKIDGYFVWSNTDNFEWSEGFRPRFGLVYVEFKSQKRIIKDSGLWFKEFLSSH